MKTGRDLNSIGCLLMGGGCLIFLLTPIVALVFAIVVRALSG